MATIEDFNKIDIRSGRIIEVEDFPVVVVNDIYGNDLYEQGRKQYQI